MVDWRKGRTAVRLNDALFRERPLRPKARIAESSARGMRMDDAWELHFRQKSRRRSRKRSREKLMKSAVLLLLFGGIASAIYLSVMGVPQ